MLSLSILPMIILVPLIDDSSRGTPRMYPMNLLSREKIHSGIKKRKEFPMDELVERLSQGDHPVVVGGPNPSLEEFRKRIEDMGYVFIKFTETRGGTDLGVRVDKSAVNVSQASFEQATGIAHVEGTLTLNYVKVRCIADIQLESLKGTGHLVILEEVTL